MAFRQWAFEHSEGNKSFKGIVLGAMAAGAMADIRADVRAIREAPCEQTKHVFREKALEHHPDKGGEAAHFRRLVAEKNASVRKCERQAAEPSRRTQKNNRGKKKGRKSKKKAGSHSKKKTNSGRWREKLPIAGLALGGAAVIYSSGKPPKRRLKRQLSKGRKRE